MEFVITNVGLAAIAAAGSGGPLVNVTTFKVGDSSGYTPLATDTDLRGSILHTGAITSYNVLSDNVVEWVCTMNESVGDFDFGEIGLYLDSGELFALFALTGLQNKLSTSSGTPNVITVRARTPSIATVASTITFEVVPDSVARPTVVADVHLLMPPVSAGSNFYLCGEDDGGNRIQASYKADYEWYISDFYDYFTGTVTGATTANQIVSTNIADQLADLASGRFIIQFLTGAHAGLVRKISGQATDTASWTESLDTPPTIGDTFAVYASAFYLGGGTPSAVPNSSVKRDANARFEAQDPTTSLEVANKNYVDVTAGDANPTNSTLLRRNSNGRAKAQNPVDNLDLVNKQYLENNFAALLGLNVTQENYSLINGSKVSEFDTTPGAGGDILGPDYYAAIVEPWDGFSISFSTDGLKMYVSSNAGLGVSDLFEYDLSEAFRPSTATYTGTSITITTAGSTSSLNDVKWKSDGSKFYVEAGDILEYTTSTPWSLSGATLTHTLSALAAGTGFAVARGILFNDTGTVIYQSYFETIGYATLSTPWDLSTATFVGTFTIPVGGYLNWNADGSKLICGYNMACQVDVPTNYALTSIVATTPEVMLPLPSFDDPENRAQFVIVDGGTRLINRIIRDDYIFETTLSTPYDLTTATLYFKHSKYEDLLNGNGDCIKWKHDGTAFYVTEVIQTASGFGTSPEIRMVEFKCRTAYDLKTAYFDGNVSPALGTGVFTFNNDGTKAYIITSGANDIEEFTMSPAYDLSTLTTTGVIFSPPPASVTSMDFADSGNKLFVGYFDVLYRLDLSTPYDLSTAVDSGNNATVPGVGFSAGPNLSFKNDGTVVWLGSGLIEKRTLSVPYDLTTMVDAGSASLFFGKTNVFDLSQDGLNLIVADNENFAQETYTVAYDYDSPTGLTDLENTNVSNLTGSVLAWNTAQTKAYVKSGSDVVQFDAPTPGSVLGLTATGASAVLDVSEPNFAYVGFFFNQNGTKLFAYGQDTSTNYPIIYQHTLSTPFDLSTAAGSPASHTFTDKPIGLVDTAQMFSGDSGNKFYLTIKGASIDGDTVYQYNLSAPNDVSTIPGTHSDSHTFSEVTDIAATHSHTIQYQFNDDGSKIFAFITGRSFYLIEYSLSTAYSISTVSAYVFAKGMIQASSVAPLNALINPDGDKISFTGTGWISEFDIVKPYEIHSVRATNLTIDLTPAPGVAFSEANPQDIWISPNGLKFYMVGSSTNLIHEFTLSTAFDLSTATFADDYDCSAEETQPRGLALSPDGLVLYVVGIVNDTVFQYNFGTPFDLTTLAYSGNSFSVAAQASVPNAVTFNGDGTAFYVADGNTSTIYEYSLGTPYDISTAAYSTRSLSVASEDTTPTGLCWNNDGTRLIVSGSTNKAIYEYGFTTPYQIDTGVYLSKVLNVNPEQVNPLGTVWSANGDRLFVTGSTDSAIHTYATNFIRLAF